MKRTVLFALLTAAVVVGPAYAQSATGSQARSAAASSAPPPGADPQWGQAVPDYRGYGLRGRRSVDPALAEATYRNALVAADCILELGDHAAEALAKQDEGPAIGRDIYRRYSVCARQPNAALAFVIDGAVAERLLVAEGVAAAAPRAPHVNVDDAARFHGDLSADQVSMASVARCAAVYSPGLALDVLRTEVGSEAEQATLAALFARTPECGLGNAPAAIPAPVQRGAIALALFRWTHLNG